jgi:hypothetical protein
MLPRIITSAAVIVAVTLLVARSPVSTAADDPPPAPAAPINSARVRDAKLACDAEVRRAESDLADRTLAAKRAYKAALDAAKAQVMKQGDLDEANRIHAEAVATEAEIKSLAAAARPVASRGLVITAARYGVPGNMKDVTDLARAHIVADALPPLKTLPDPAFGQAKTFVLEGTFGGREFVLTLPEAFAASGLYFGAPPKTKP